MKIFLIWIFYPFLFPILQMTEAFTLMLLLIGLRFFLLTEEMIGFYKPHIQHITKNDVNTDRGRYAVKGEADKHFIDLEYYGDSALQILPKYWSEAVEKFSEASLRANGIGPWSAYFTFLNLTKAFESKNSKAILRLSADLGH